MNGFDLLRANGKSLVCDVNGFSFVKTSQKYYDDASQLLAEIILQKLAPQLWIPQSITLSRGSPMLNRKGTPIGVAGVCIYRHYFYMERKYLEKTSVFLCDNQL